MALHECKEDLPVFLQVLKGQDIADRGKPYGDDDGNEEKEEYGSSIPSNHA